MQWFIIGCITGYSLAFELNLRIDVYKGIGSHAVDEGVKNIFQCV